MRYSRQRKHVRRHGLSLIEVMVALVVLAFGLLGVAALRLHAVKGQSGGYHLSGASAIARNRIEEISRLAFASATLNDSANAWVNSTTIQTADQAFARTERIADDGADLKHLEVRVVWSDNLRQGRSVVVSSKKLKETDE